MQLIQQSKLIPKNSVTQDSMKTTSRFFTLLAELAFDTASATTALAADENVRVLERTNTKLVWRFWRPSDPLIGMLTHAHPN